jgi:hypothetical protein
LALNCFDDWGSAAQSADKAPDIERKIVQSFAGCAQVSAEKYIEKRFVKEFNTSLMNS